MADGEWRKGIARSACASLSPRSSTFVLCLALFAPGGVPAMAQALVDPTQPPLVLSPATPVIEGAASPVQQLQSVIISPTRKAAIINGVVVELGDKYGDAVLTKVGEDEVVLSSNGSREVLKLYPAVEKVGVAPGGAKGAPRKAVPKANPQQGAKPAAQGKQP